MARILHIGAKVLATVLFIVNFDRAASPNFFMFLPMILIVLVVINSFWFSRFTSWLIFALSFFSFLVILSAFTMRWRLEPGFNSKPFYSSMVMYVAFIYVSLGQLKLQGGASASHHPQTKEAV